MLRGDDNNGIGRPYPLAKLRPCRWRILLAILIINRQMSDLDEAELQRNGRKFGKRMSHFPVERIPPKAADDNGDFACLLH